MPPTPKCQHNNGTYIHVVGRMELTKCSDCDAVLRRTEVGSDPRED